MSEATDPRSDVNRRGVGWHYEAFYVLDNAAKALDDAQKRVAKQYSYLDDKGTIHEADTSGFVWGVRRVEDE